MIGFHVCILFYCRYRIVLANPFRTQVQKGRQNRQGTGRKRRCQTWIKGEGRGAVLGQWPIEKKGKRWSRVVMKVQTCRLARVPKCKNGKTRSCLREDWSLRSKRESLRILIKRKTNVETLSIDRAHCGDDIFSFLSLRPSLFYAYGY